MQHAKLTSNRAKIEITRIFNSLNFSDSLKELVFTKFKKFRDTLKLGSKYRSVEKLVPTSIYFCLKFQHISINEVELLEVSKILKKDFNAFKLQMRNLFPQYRERNRINQEFKDFINRYGNCPVCGSKNHRSYLLSFYHDDKQKKLRDYLIEGVKLSPTIKNFKISLGIPCCSCFDKFLKN